MHEIETGFDPLLKVEYSLISVGYSELREMFLSSDIYKDVDLSAFDSHSEYSRKEEVDIVQSKLSGLVGSLFYAYAEAPNRLFLLDGYNRLFTDYGKIESDVRVYLKIIKSPLSDSKLMYIMFLLNMWKTSNLGSKSEFKLSMFFDRGFRLLMWVKYNITLNKDNIYNVIDHYFNQEHDFAGYFKYSLHNIAVLMSKPNIVNDIRTLSEVSLDELFPNYGQYLKSVAMHLNYLRLEKKDDTKYSIEDWLALLYQHDKFFNKLKKMSWTDMTRQAIFKFLRGL